MNKVILADSQAIFRAGTAKVLAMDEDLRIIAQCTDLDRMYHAITTFPGSIVLFAASLRPDLSRLHMLLETIGSRGIVIAENNEAPAPICSRAFAAWSSAMSPVRHWSSASAAWPPAKPGYRPSSCMPESPEEDMVGTRVRDRLTPKEMRIVALIVQGCKNREIALRLKTTEQVIKNYLRSIYDKTGVRRPPGAGPVHHPPPRPGPGRRRSGQQARSRRASPAPTPSPEEILA